jgi:hypothetical protein
VLQEAQEQLEPHLQVEPQQFVELLALMVAVVLVFVVVVLGPNIYNV